MIALIPPPPRLVTDRKFFPNPFPAESFHVIYECLLTSKHIFYYFVFSSVEKIHTFQMTILFFLEHGRL